MKSNLLRTLFDAFKNVAMIQLSRKCFRQTQMKRNEIRQTVRYNYYVCYLLIKLFCLEKDRKLIMRARANESNSSLNSGKPTDVRYG